MSLTQTTQETNSGRCGVSWLQCKCLLNVKYLHKIISIIFLLFKLYYKHIIWSIKVEPFKRDTISTNWCDSLHIICKISVNNKNKDQQIIRPQNTSCLSIFFKTVSWLKLVFSMVFPGLERLAWSKVLLSKHEFPAPCQK